VRDTGIGIPEDKRSVIFEAFSQADGSTTRQFGGTGLGLTISSQLASLMNGRIGVESRPGEGSCFHLSLPVGARKLPPAAPDAELAKLDGLPVLVVDDNATSRRILCEMLARCGMMPAEAAGGEAAMLLVRQTGRDQAPFAMALIDSAMPGMDGFALTEQLRRQPGMVGPVIMLTSLSPGLEDNARCRGRGVHTVLGKPAGWAGLRRALLQACGHATARQDQPVPAKRLDRRGSLRPLRVLIAEDNRINQLVAARLLEKQGHSVAVAANGVEALVAIGKEAFDLVLMDGQMPEMDGFQAAAAIREREKLTGGHLRIIALTAHAMAGDRDRFLAAGMDDYLTKPIQPVQLFAAIEEITANFIPLQANCQK
jgi:CheY-like chemotaxis protein